MYESPAHSTRLACLQLMAALRSSTGRGGAAQPREKKSKSDRGGEIWQMKGKRNKSAQCYPAGLAYNLSFPVIKSRRVACGAGESQSNSHIAR